MNDFVLLCRDCLERGLEEQASRCNIHFDVMRLSFVATCEMCGHSELVVVDSIDPPSPEKAAKILEKKRIEAELRRSKN